MYRGYRAMLEYYTSEVKDVPVDSSEKLRRGFEDESVYDLTLMICHGWGKTDDDAVLNWEFNDHSNVQDQDRDELHLTKDNVSEYITRGSGTLLSTACWGARQLWANAFLDAGFDWYVASEKTSDMFSAYQFVAAFIGYLVYEERDMGRRIVEVSEAVELAGRIDDFWDGARGFRAVTR